MKPDRERFRLLKEVAAKHGDTMEPYGVQSLAAERGQASDELAETVHRGCS